MITRRGPEFIHFTGKMPLAGPEGVARKTFFFRNGDNLDQQLQRFGETEKLPQKTWATEVMLCE